MVDHKKSTYVLVIFLLISLLTGVASVLKSEDIDDLCNTDNSTLFRWNGTWVCASLFDASFNVSVNNVTIYNNRTSYWGDLNSTYNRFVYNHTETATTDWAYANATYVEIAGDTMTGQLTIDNTIDIHGNGGLYNIFIGENAGSLINAQGTQNAVLGAFAGDALTSGKANMLVGTSAGTRLTSGERNVFIGGSTGAFITTQSDMMFIGNNAGRLVTGVNNVCIGTNACEGSTSTTTTGTNNFFFGANTGKELSSGSGNVGLGSGALQRVKYADENIAIGTSALPFHQGDNVIAIGYQTGRFYNGTGSILIGKQVGWDIGLPDNILMIDNTNRNDTLLFGNFEGRNLTINGDLQVTQNVTGNFYYGELWFNNESSSGRLTTISSSMVWYNITGFDQINGDGGSELNGFTEPQAGALVPTFGGMYNVEYSISFERATGAVSREYEIGVAVNGVIQNKSVSHRTIGNANDVGDADQDFKLRLTAGDIVTLMINNRGGSEDAGVHNAVLGMDRIGD